jgi:molybdopterin synthase sulfur carrier subunit
MVKIRIPTPLRTYTKNREEVEASGSTISEVLADLEKNCPGIQTRLLDEKGALRRYVNIFCNDEDIRYLGELKTTVKDGDRSAIIPAIAGGDR